MKSLKYKLFEYRKNLNFEQSEIDTIVNEHVELCNEYSEKEVFKNLSLQLENYKFYDSVKTILESIDEELSKDPLLYTLKDLYAKIKRKGDTFLYENTLNSILDIINETNDEDRKIKILEDLKMYDWIPEIQFFLSEVAEMPQEKQNFLAKGGKIDDVYSIVLQLKEGYLTYVEDKWFLLNDEGINVTLLENHIKDENLLRKYRLIEQAIGYAEFTDNTITFNISEELEVTFDTDKKKVLLNGVESEEDTTLESLFNSPLVPYLGKGFYPILNETFINLDKFMKIDTVKKIYNVANPTFECYVFKYNNFITQYRLDGRQGKSIYTYESATPIVESVMQELGADLTFFFEDLLSDEMKKINNIEKEEKVLVEKLEDIENSILKIKDEKELMNENTTLKNLYNTLLGNKHKYSEELKELKNQKSKLLA